MAGFVSRCPDLGDKKPLQIMPYITCTKKKSHPKVSIEVCARCRVKNCPDYKSFRQPTLFPFFVPDKALKSLPIKKIKPELGTFENITEQMNLWRLCNETPRGVI